MSCCSTLGCNATPTAELVWYEYPSEPVCDDCADSYSRRARNGVEYWVKRPGVRIDTANYSCCCPYACGCTSKLYWPSTMCSTCYAECE